jgi:hypothetical protein
MIYEEFAQQTTEAVIPHEDILEWKWQSWGWHKPKYCDSRCQGTGG